MKTILVVYNANNRKGESIIGNMSVTLKQYPLSETDILDVMGYIEKKNNLSKLLILNIIPLADKTEEL